MAGGIIREEVIGRARLLLGDAREILPLLPKADLLCTDPPYGIGEHGGACRTRGKPGYAKHEAKGWDNARPSNEVFKLMLEAAPAQIIWGGNYFADMLPPRMGWLYWRKLMGGDFSDGELAWTSRSGALREFTKCPKGMDKSHPCEKPIPLMRWCLSFFPDAQVVLDPFMGSAATGVAALQARKTFIGIERDPDYFELSVRRIAEASGQDLGPLFIGAAA